MSDAEVLFSKGDTVVWNPAMLGQSYHPKDRLGDGPFMVTSTTTVPSACSYPDSYCSFGGHHESCNVSNRQSVGHPQWVDIQPADGATVSEGQTLDGPQEVSGAWFVRA